MYSPRGARIALEEANWQQGHVDMMMGFIAFKRAKGPDKFTFGTTTQSLSREAVLPSVMEHTTDSLSALFFQPEEYLRFFPAYYANPPVYDFDTGAMTGEAPSDHELSVTRRVHY